MARLCNFRVWSGQLHNGVRKRLPPLIAPGSIGMCVFGSPGVVIATLAITTSSINRSSPPEP